MRASGMCLIALALVGVSACERKNDQKTGETTTTSGDTADSTEAQRAEQARKPALPLMPPPAVTTEAPKAEEPAAPTKDAKTAKSKAEAAPGKVEAAPGKAEAPAGKAEAPKKHLRKKRAANEAAQPKAEEEPVGRTTITAVEITTVPQTTPTTPPAETPATPATPPGGMPLPADVASQPYVNHSTVFGDGKSGTYTDNQGTYGGRATWGTGGGIPASPPPRR